VCQLYLYLYTNIVATPDSWVSWICPHGHGYKPEVDIGYSPSRQTANGVPTLEHAPWHRIRGKSWWIPH